VRRGNAHKTGGARVKSSDTEAPPCKIQNPVTCLKHPQGHAAPTVVDPKRFSDVAAQIAQLFARAHIVLASLKAHGQ
jgi:hypothetical protein